MTGKAKYVSISEFSGEMPKNLLKGRSGRLVRPHMQHKRFFPRGARVPDSH